MYLIAKMCSWQILALKIHRPNIKQKFLQTCGGLPFFNAYVCIDNVKNYKLVMIKLIVLDFFPQYFTILQTSFHDCDIKTTANLLCKKASPNTKYQ
jgi:hypothetical protein